MDCRKSLLSQGSLKELSFKHFFPPSDRLSTTPSTSTMNKLILIVENIENIVICQITWISSNELETLFPIYEFFTFIKLLIFEFHVVNDDDDVMLRLGYGSVSVRGKKPGRRHLLNFEVFPFLGNSHIFPIKSKWNWFLFYSTIS